jgi:hypothetical protein
MQDEKLTRPRLGPCRVSSNTEARSTQRDTEENLTQNSMKTITVLGRRGGSVASPPAETSPRNPQPTTRNPQPATHNPQTCSHV